MILCTFSVQHLPSLHSQLCGESSARIKNSEQMDVVQSTPKHTVAMSESDNSPNECLFQSTVATVVPVSL